LIGHITKEGTIAGPKILEHMVDVVLQFEGDRNHTYRILRAQKNRFGSTAELGIYEMQSVGLREVENPSEILISEKDESLSGTAIAATLEGMRPLMIEVQALVSTAVYGTPQRSATGYNIKRLNMILAVLEKRAGFRLGAKDVFLNIAGGISVDDPAIDLAVVASILSSNEDEAIPQDFCFAAEVGLAGEIRPVNRIDQRILEAEKLGFSTIIVSKFNKITKSNYKIKVVLVSKIEEVYQQLF
jgi:DNA repair protein RadA/Sms